MDPRLLRNATFLVQQHFTAGGSRDYESTRAYVVEHYRKVFPVVNEDVWQRTVNPELERAVRELVSEKSNSTATRWLLAATGGEHGVFLRL